MGTTANFGWEYTDPTDLLGAGFANDQQTAEQIDATVAAHRADVLARTAASWCHGGDAAQQNLAEGAKAAVNLSLSSSSAGDWSFDGAATFTYTGTANRLVLVNAYARVVTPGVQEGVAAIGRIVVDNAVIAAEHQAVVNPTNDFDQRLLWQHTLTLVAVIGCYPGTTITLEVENPTNSNVASLDVLADRQLQCTSLGWF